MKPQVDRALLAGHVRQWLSENGKSYRIAAGEFPILNPAMLSRACSEQVLSVESFLALCCVIGLQPMDYLRGNGEAKQSVTAMGKRETSFADERGEA